LLTGFAYLAALALVAALALFVALVCGRPAQWPVARCGPGWDSGRGLVDSPGHSGDGRAAGLAPCVQAPGAV